jgi:hypothetical protein
MAEVVRASVDVGEGHRELAVLLEGWRARLEETVKRAAPGETSLGDSSESSSRRAAHTLRYEEVALAFDEDVPDDGPTFEAHALPSDPAVVVARRVVPEEPAAEIPVPPERVVAAAPAPVPQSPTPAARKGTMPRFRVALVAFVAVGIVMALVAAFAHLVP